MRIVAVGARYFPLWKWHMGALGEFGALLFVAGVTRFVDRCFLEEAAVRDFCHRVVTITASKLVSTVGRTRPKHRVATLVAGEAHAVLPLDGSSPLAGEAD